MKTNENKLFAQQVKVLYERGLSAVPINIIIGAILSVILLPVVELPSLLGWWGVLTAISLFRFVHLKFILKYGDWLNKAKSYRDLFALLAGVTGCIWMSTFFLFGFFVPDIYLIFIVFTLGGMAVGAIASMATSRLAFFAYILPMTLPLCVVFLFEGDVLGYAMSSMLAIYVISISLTFMQSAKLIRQAIENQFEKDALIQHLKISNQHLELANEKIMALSHTDELTQVANRRYLDIVLAKEWARAVRSQLPITFIMVDIDFFKPYNDKYGHHQGDQCLKKIAHVMNHVIKRPGDFVARYGGEEFAIILPDTTLDGAQSLMESYQEEIQKLQIPAANTTVNAFVTVSIGMSNITPGVNDDLNELVASADAALYKAKQSGRNQIQHKQLSSADVNPA